MDAGPPPPKQYEEARYAAAAVMVKMKDTLEETAVGLSIPQLQELFEIHKRTVYRMLNALKAHYDVKTTRRTGAHGNYYFIQSDKNRRLWDGRRTWFA